MANRLKGLVPEIISQEQSTFVPRRLITDNVLVAFEVLHSIGRKVGGKEGLMGIKLDMSKAYDRVKWPFLEGIMRRLGFGDRWTRLVMDCVLTTHFSYIINCSVEGNVIP